MQFSVVAISPLKDTSPSTDTSTDRSSHTEITVALIMGTLANFKDLVGAFFSTNFPFVVTFIFQEEVVLF